MTESSATASAEPSGRSLTDSGTYRFDAGSILPTTEPNLAGNHPQASLEAVSGIFGGVASAIYVEPQISSIPKPLRHVWGAPIGKWQPPWQIIGVKCGASSQGLCAIIFENKAVFRVFITNNPALKDTLLTWWPEGNCVIWVHSTDWVPPNVTGAGIWLVSEGIIPVAAPGLVPDHFVWQDRPVVSMPFAEINWPADMQASFQIPLLQHMYGPRYRRVGPRKTVLNLTFWAHFLTGKMGLVYHVQRESFFIRSPGTETLESLPVDELIKLTIHGLQQAANLDPNQFPASEMRLPIIKKLIEEMQVAAGLNTPNEKEGLVQFLKDGVEIRKGSNLTVAELHDRYTISCRTKTVMIYPESIFQRLLPACIRELFAVAKCNNLRRRGPEGSVHWHRGFRNLAFKTI